jgi:filamentous hemagglutinin
MSKENSNHFSRTNGANKALVDELVSSGEKCTPENIVAITKDSSGRIVWLETGNDRAGLNHIIDEHGSQFHGKGISNEEIPNYVMEAIHQGNIVGYQGKKNPRTIYEFVYEGKKQRIAISIGPNGFIVGANPKSVKE